MLPLMTRTPLSIYTRLVKVEQGHGFQCLTFALETPWALCFASRGGLKGTICVTLVDGLDRVDFKTDMHSAAFNHRMRVAFPLPAAGKHLYGIPYGMLERQPYEPWFAWASASGDWPAVNWAGVQSEGLSVALLNKGTPSSRIERARSGGDVLLLSILRSPAIPTYLHEPEFYSMTAYDGMRDEGYNAGLFAAVEQRWRKFIGIPRSFKKFPLLASEKGKKLTVCVYFAAEGGVFCPSMRAFTTSYTAGNTEMKMMAITMIEKLFLTISRLPIRKPPKRKIAVHSRPPNTL